MTLTVLNVLKLYRSYSWLKLIMNSGAHCGIAHYYLSLTNSTARAKFEGFITLLRTGSRPMICYAVIIGKYLLPFWKTIVLLLTVEFTVDVGESRPSRFFYQYPPPTCGPRIVVGIATGYGLDGSGIESRWGRDFPHLSRPVLGPIQPSVQWVPVLFRG